MKSTKIPLKAYWDVLANYLRPQLGRVVLLAVLLFSNIGLQLVNPQIMRRFLDAAMLARLRIPWGLRFGT